MSRRGWIAGAALVGGAGLVVWGAVVLGGPREDDGIRAGLAPGDVLAGVDTAGYARAVEPRSFRFPEDYGPHPEFRTEWWDLTGNLTAEGGREMGFQATFFRNALAPPDSAPERRSAWATRQVYMAHLALTDRSRGRHDAVERFARGAGGLAGARTEPFAVWLEDWRLEAGNGTLFPLRLRAGEGPVALDLELERGKPPVLHGRGGLSRKGPEPGNASYYFSLTRMRTRGTVVAGSDTLAVEGSAWMDREWSTSALGPDLAGWDWFGLQLSDGRELMYYRLRRADGTAHPLSSGTLVDPDGSSTALTADQVRVEVLDRWESPLDGAPYPSRWRVRIPSVRLDLEVVPRLPAQEMDLTFRYWEGAVGIEGQSPGGPLSGAGYVELTGYAGGDASRPGAGG